MYGRSMYGGYGGMYGGYGGYGGMYGGGMYGGMGPGMGSSYAESMFRMTQMLEMNSILKEDDSVINQHLIAVITQHLIAVTCSYQFTCGSLLLISVTSLHLFTR